MVQKKICMLGAFAVGKTSLVSKFVHSIFSEEYHTTVGVKIDKKQLSLDGQDVTLILWDLSGEDELMKIRTSYLRGAAGYLLVVDGTRRATLETARMLRTRVENEVGSLPFVVVLNKVDLTDEWELDESAVDELASDAHPILQTSAKTGQGVEELFHRLAQEMLEKTG